MKLEEFNKKLACYHDVDFRGPINEVEIQKAERELSCKLPPQYRSFLLNYGSGGIGPENFIGLGGPDYLDIIKLTSILRNRNNPLPNNLIPLRGDGFGNYDCIDLLKPTNNGEYSVVQWSHEGGGAEILASSFDEWFNLILTLIDEEN